MALQELVSDLPQVYHHDEEKDKVRKRGMLRFNEFISDVKRERGSINKKIL